MARLTRVSSPAEALAKAGAPRLWLRLEGAVVLVAATVAYAQVGSGWLLYVLLFFVPDISFAAYALSPRFGALGYNLLHSYALPLLALVVGGVGVHVDLNMPLVGWVDASPALLAWPLVWLAHIGFDRMLGYGLKYPSAFKDTHLGRL